jgi:hypothetical protein
MTSSAGIAQNAKADILRINEAYSKFIDMSMNITYNVFLNYSTALPYETEVGFFKQHRNQRYNKLKEIESLQNKDYLVVVDNDQRRIVVGNPVKFDPSKITLLNLDSALSTCSSVSYLDDKPGLGGYSMRFKPNTISAFDKIELYFDKKTYIVEKLFFYYRQEMKLSKETDAISEKPRLEITFSKFDFKTVNDESVFSESKFIEKKNGKYVAANTYKDYQVIDQKFLK